jgi:hypothetical protein
MARFQVLFNTSMIIRCNEIFSNPTCNIKDKKNPYKHRPLSCAEFRELQWKNAAFHKFPGFLIVCFGEDCVWLSNEESTVLKENASNIWKHIQIKLREKKHTALMMAFHQRLGEKSLLGLLDVDLVRRIML